MRQRIKQYGTHPLVDHKYLLSFHCPGCREDHVIIVAKWNWNGSMSMPTIIPPLRINLHDPAKYCHAIVTEGKIEFCKDSWHYLKGFTVELPEMEIANGVAGDD